MNKAEEWVGKVMWMSRVNEQDNVNRGRMIEAYWETKRGACSRSVVAGGLVCSGSWSQHRSEWVGDCWGKAIH